MYGIDCIIIIMQDTHECEKQLLLKLKQHYGQAFSELNSLIEAYLLSKNRKQHSLKLRQIKQQLEKELEPFKEENSRPFFCGKAFAPTSNSRKINVYTCQECRQEFNSTACEECFDVSKHEGHRYKRIQLASGSCDCGSRSKWLEKSFCQVHKFTDQTIGQMANKQEYRIKLHYFFKVLHVISRFTTQLNVQQKTDLRTFDSLCASFIEQLNELNRRDKATNQTTSSLLGQKQSLGPSGEIEIREILLSFTKLSATAEKCIQLLNTLFVLNESLQAQIAEIYLSRHQEFFSTPYRHLTHIVFANGLLMSRNSNLWSLHKVFDSSQAQQNQSFVQQVYNSYKRQFLNLNNINNLYHASSIDCWANFYQNGRFTCAGDYCAFLKTNEQHMQLNLLYYDIEKIFIGQMIKTIDIVRQEEFFHKICFQLFQKITSPTEEAPLANNLLFTYERLWAACTYALIVQTNGSFEASFESFLENALRLVSKQKPIAKFVFLLDKILNYMQVSNVRPVAHQQRHKSFVTVYYKNTGYLDDCGVLLANVDAIFFKIVVRMLSYLSPKGSKGTIINQKINQYILKVFEQAQRNLLLTNMKHRFLSLINFIEKLHEFLYSQYSDLFLATKFQGFRTQQYYLNKHKSYLHNMLSSLSVGAIEAKTFEILFKHFLFDAPEAYNSFKIQMAEQDHQRFITANAKGRKIKITFLPSLVGKRSPQTQKYYDQDKILIDASTYPNQKCSHSLPYHLLQSQAFESLKDIFQRLVQKRYNQFRLIFRTIKYLAAYPQLASHKMKEVLQFVQIQQIDFFKNRQQKGKQQHLLGGFIVQQYQKEEEDSWLKKYANQAQEQRDQDLRQKTEQKKYNNNSPSELGRIEQKQTEQKEQSGKSSKQSRTTSEKIAEFKAQCSKCNKPTQNIALLCFVSFKRVPSVFDLLPDQKCLIFTSCQHFFHQHEDCLPKIEPSGFGSCPICSRKFNFLLILPDTYTESREEKYSRVIKLIDSFVKSAKLFDETNKNQIWYFRALKSFVLFLLMMSMVTKLQESDFYVYKTLAKMLQVYFDSSRTFKEKQYVMSKMFEVKEHSQQKDLIKYLTCIVGEALIPYQREKFVEERKSISLSLSQKQSLNIKHAINQCFGYKSTLPVTSLEQPHKIHLFELPDDLQLLTQRYTGICQSCKSNIPKISFVVCLHPLHSEKKMEEKTCVSCVDSFISQHIRVIESDKRTERYIRHEKEMLTITSDTGDVTYYARLNKKIWALQLGSVYLDDNLDKLTVSQAINADKIPSRSTFKLKREKYEEIALNFYMRRYLGSGSLQLFLEQ